MGYRGCPKSVKEKMAEHNWQTGIKKLGALAERFSEIAKEWDCSKNKLTTSDYPSNSVEDVLWIYKKYVHSILLLNTQILQKKVAF